MAYNGRPPTARQQAEARFAKSEKHDAQFFRERKAKEAANIAKTLELRALRLAKEAQDRAAAAAAPAPVKPKRRARTTPAA